MANTSIVTKSNPRTNSLIQVAQTALNQKLGNVDWKYRTPLALVVESWN